VPIQDSNLIVIAWFRIVRLELGWEWRCSERSLETFDDGIESFLSFEATLDPYVAEALSMTPR
jgi:hypothetical protein